MFCTADWLDLVRWVLGCKSFCAGSAWCWWDWAVGVRFSARVLGRWFSVLGVGLLGFRPWVIRLVGGGFRSVSRSLGFLPQVAERNVFCDLWLEGGLCGNLYDFEIRHFPTILEFDVLIECWVMSPYFELRRYLPLGAYPRMVKGWSIASSNTIRRTWHAPYG